MKRQFNTNHRISAFELVSCCLSDRSDVQHCLPHASRLLHTNKSAVRTQTVLTLAFKHREAEKVSGHVPRGVCTPLVSAAT